MFSSKLEESNLKEKMLNCGKEQVVLDSYGLRIGGAYRKFQYLYTHLVQLSTIGWFGGFWIAIGLMVTVVFYLWIAEYVHPYIHQSHQQALKCASPLMKVFIRSRYFRLLTKHHFLHHKYINCNFNLVLGGDFILGTHREPTKGDIAEMKSLGLFV
jgi:hypothetical protein